MSLITEKLLLTQLRYEACPGPSSLLPEHLGLVCVTVSVTLECNNLSADLYVPTGHEFLKAGPPSALQHPSPGPYSTALTNEG